MAVFCQRRSSSSSGSVRTIKRRHEASISPGPHSRPSAALSLNLRWVIVASSVHQDIPGRRDRESIVVGNWRRHLALVFCFASTRSTWEDHYKSQRIQTRTTAATATSFGCVTTIDCSIWPASRHIQSPSTAHPTYYPCTSTRMPFVRTVRFNCTTRWLPAILAVVVSSRSVKASSLAT